MEPKTPILSSRFSEALAYAVELHHDQFRKGTGIPYIAHLLGVTALVLEMGGDEDEAIAALLHDAVEDQGGLPTLEAIRQRFGARVAAIVEGCTDAFTRPKPPWLERKEKYLAHLDEASASVRLVSLADKVHNARAIIRDLSVKGDEIWEKFNGGKEGTLWYYRALADTFARLDDNYLVDQLRNIVAEIEAIASESSQGDAA